ncbi:transmembrane protein 80 isoform X3 [Monodelphis domestica]|uniref:transmembrane protein 80 isoform X3 n=1 Tax=Monodelphis domestica TaxID=13616 RepID=UPI0024E1D55D|nr:transmembrane protein 80 isoform X3 [Monodelphis domestica]
MTLHNAGRTSLLSSVPLQIQFCLSGLYFPFYFLASLLMMVFYKKHFFIYPPNYLAMDLTLLCVLGLLEVLRLHLGSKGNLVEEELLLGGSLALTVLNTFLSVYFLLWATYVLRADVFLNTVLLALYNLEGILQMVTIAAFLS